MQPPPFGPPPPPPAPPPAGPPFAPPGAYAQQLPYPQQAPYPPQPYPGYPPAMVGAPAAPTESKATIALVLGIFSLATMFCYLGFLLGIPAIILGSLSRRDIARSNGTLGGGGVATGGIVCGAIGALVNAGQIAIVVAMMIFATTSASSATVTPPPPPPPVYAPTTTAPTAPTVAPTPPATPPSFGALAVRTLDASDGPLKTQLLGALITANASKRSIVAYTTASWCAECAEIEGEMKDPSIVSALAGASVVRVDVDAFKGQLAEVGMEQPVLPYFFVFDGTSGSTLRPARSISANAWGANTAANMAGPLKRLVSAGAKPAPPAPAPSTKGTAL